MAKLANRMDIVQQDGKAFAIIVQELDTSRGTLTGTEKSYKEFSTGRFGTEVVEADGRVHKIICTIFEPVAKGVKPQVQPVQALTMEDLMTAMQQLQAKK